MNLNVTMAASSGHAWRKAAEQSDGSVSYDYVRLYMDDMLVESANTENIEHILKHELRKYWTRKRGPDESNAGTSPSDPKYRKNKVTDK
jgi:hypothetical protein